MGQLDGIGPEGVGLEQLGPSVDVIPVNSSNQIGLLEVELIVADVEKHSAGVQHGAHGSIRHVYPAITQELPKRSHRS
jgi:hypothetical protein